MIEIKHPEGSSEPRLYKLFIDGSLVDSAVVGIAHEMDGRAVPGDLTASDPVVIQQIIQHPISEFPPLDYLSLKYPTEWLGVINQILITYREDGDSEIYFYSQPDLSNWKKEYGFGEYCDELSLVIEAKKDPEFKFSKYTYEQEYVVSFGFDFPFSSPQLPIIYELNKRAEVLRELHEEVYATLAAKYRADSVSVSFDFPEEVRVPCEQYLLYFVQFLKDLGVEATAELQHQAGQVLFAVTPVNKEDALDKIRTALETYLQLPANPAGDTLNIGHEIEIQRLAANIDHLKGQLRLAHAVLQAKDATVHAQQLTIRQQEHLLSGEIVIYSMKNVTPKSEVTDAEEVLGGLAEIKNYEGKGFSVKLPEIYRRLKELFRK